MKKINHLIDQLFIRIFSPIFPFLDENNEEWVSDNPTEKNEGKSGVSLPQRGVAKTNEYNFTKFMIIFFILVLATLMITWLLNPLSLPPQRPNKKYLKPAQPVRPVQPVKEINYKIALDHPTKWMVFFYCTRENPAQYWAGSLKSIDLCNLI